MIRPNAPDSFFDRHYLWTICLVAALGGLLFGYDWVVIGGAKPFYEPYFAITDNPWMQGWTMSSALVGCLIGAVISGAAADRIGRKRFLVIAAALFVVSALGSAVSSGLFDFNAFRMLGGIGIGLASNLSPLYIAEVSPASTRGRMVSINQLTIVIGVLSAQIVNWAIARDVSELATASTIAVSWNGQHGWRWMFAAEAIPAIVFLALSTIIPESPRWLVRVGNVSQAKSILERIGGPEYAIAQIKGIQETLLPRDDAGESGAVDSLPWPALMIGVFLAVLQQWCGINVIFNYAQEVFAAAGYGVSSIMLNIIISGVVNLVFTVVAMLTVDLVGRRTMLLAGSGGLALIYSALGGCYWMQSQGVHVLLLIVAAIACYAMTLAPVVWVVISEIFPNRNRGRTMAIAVFSLWTACTILTFTFPFLSRSLGAHGTFWLYGVICAVGCAVIAKILPETKGQSLESIEQSWKG
ncbi:D-xylose-proton symporter [Rubripirellula tenax]|uniref:D-xylose-proton symporter n=1 Tax=Rubripirellula tenax TaxID=2528015 RepID=A0A5C6FFN1_9BACT|nr:sugar porter family MFS transporter [Rubripirellula tenax]TWU60218.1 D-xylose-proton symporter [Rubripirellula tenax]